MRDRARPGPGPTTGSSGEEFGVTGTRAPALDHRPDRRHEVVPARLAAVGHAARARGRRRPGARGGVGAGARPALVGDARRRRVRQRRAHPRVGRRVARRRAAVPRRRALLRGLRLRPGVRRAHPPRCGTGAASATSGATCWWPRAIADVMVEPILAIWDVAALIPIVRGGGRPGDRPPGRAPRRRRQRRHHQRAPARRGARARRRGRLGPRRIRVVSARAPVTVGIDIGTSSVKAIAADDDGNVVAGAGCRTGSASRRPGRFEHDVQSAWRDGPRAALAAVGPRSTAPVRGVSVAAMVPSLTAVDAAGVAAAPGPPLRRRAGAAAGGPTPATRSRTASCATSLRWMVRAGARRRGAVARAGGGQPRAGGRSRARHLDRRDRVPAVRLPAAGTRRWSRRSARAVEQLPRLVPTGWECGTGRRRRSRARVGVHRRARRAARGRRRRRRRRARDPRHDAHRLGRRPTRRAEVPGYWTIPHTASGKLLVGGPEQRGRAVLRLGPPPGRRPHGRRRRGPGRVPVWAPYPRGRARAARTTRTAAPCSPTSTSRTTPPRSVAPRTRRRASSPGGCSTLRAPTAASTPRRIVATGGGIRVDEWVQAVADATELPVECVAVPEGGALGLGVARPHRGRARGADGDDRGSALGPRRAHRSSPTPRGSSRCASATSASSRYRRSLA